MYRRTRLVCLLVALLAPAVAVAATVATPKFSPLGGTYSTPQSVVLSTATPGAKIYYTTNGTTPTTSSTLYAGPVVVTSTKTLKARATATGYTNSAVASATYTLVAATPAFSPAGGTYSTPQSVALSSATPGAKIYYTTNGATPTTSSTLYTGPVTVTSTRTLKALATATGYSSSAVGAATYTITLPPTATPSLSPLPGSYPGEQWVTVSDSTPGATTYCTLDGSQPTTSSMVCGDPIPISIYNSNRIVKAMAVAPGYAPSPVVTGTYAVGSGASTERVASVKGTGTVTTQPISTSIAEQSLVAFVSATGPAGSAQSATVSGGGLAWALVARANSQAGTAEVWTLSDPLIS